MFEVIDPNLPCGAAVTTQQRIEMKCPRCGSQWEVLVTHELGTDVLQDEDDARCPECGTEGEM